MSEILSIGGNGNPLQAIGARRPAGTGVSSVPGDRGSDSVEVSPTATLLAKLSQLPDVRQGLVDSVKSQIAAGTYDSDGDKFDQAMESMMSDLSN